MNVLAASVAAFLVFSPSVDQRVPASEAGYRCTAWERHSYFAACPCPPGGCHEFETCEFMSAPAPVACPVRAYTDPVFIWQGVSLEPAPGQVVYGCVQAVLPGGATSECWGDR